MRRSAFALTLCLASALSAASARAVKAPKELCLEWTAGADQTDTITLDFVLRPVPKTFATEHATDGRTQYKLYSLHGLAGRGVLPDGPFPVIAGSAFHSRDGTSLLLGILLISDEGVFTFRGVFPLELGPVAMRRIAPDGTFTAGFFDRLDCSEVTVGN